MLDVPLTDPDPEPEGEANALAAAALSAVRSGDGASAEALLEKALKARHAGDLPVAFFAAALRSSGQAELAERFTIRALAEGLDVIAAIPSLESRLAGMAPDEARRLCARYQSAFAAGQINACMVGRYALALGRAGDEAALAALFPQDRIFRHKVLDRIDGFPSVGAFNGQLLAEMRGEAYHSFYNGRRYMQDVERLQHIHKVKTPAVRAFLDLVQAELADYAQALDLPPDHPLMRLRPADQRLYAWANVYRAGAYVEPHIHAAAWLVAVYYPEAPAGMTEGDPQAGAFRLGCPQGASCGGWPNLTVNPVPGTLFIMPAYCHHWSVPFRGGGERVAVAVDWLRP